MYVPDSRRNSNHGNDFEILLTLEGKADKYQEFVACQLECMVLGCKKSIYTSIRAFDSFKFFVCVYVARGCEKSAYRFLWKSFLWKILNCCRMGAVCNSRK